MSLTKWLEHQHHYPKFYFSPRGEDYALAGAGIKRESNKPFEGAFGIVSFDGDVKRFVEPMSSLRSTLSPQKFLNTGLLRYACNDDCMMHNDDYVSIVTKALQAIKQNQFEKVVLAHKRTLSLTIPINPFDLLDRLQAYIPNAYHYLYQPDPGVTFLGASPEQLFKRHGRKIYTEAQAGTKPKGSPIEELLDSPKEQYEHQLVINNLLSVLHSLCIDYGITHEREINALAQVQHLRTRLRGILRELITDANILDLLHPTAAVCGWPKHPAFEFIKSHEPFERGFYAGTIGYIGKNQTEFAVAIRSALVKDCQIKIFGGAGIVSGSIPTKEWAEIENKINFWSQL